MAMHIINIPRHFDVVLTESLFGDILSDEAGVITGSLGMLPSATIGGAVNLYEPVHGSAPDIAGTGKANPLGAILTAAMILRHSANLEQEAKAVEQAVNRVLDAGYAPPTYLVVRSAKPRSTLRRWAGWSIGPSPNPPPATSPSTSSKSATRDRRNRKRMLEQHSNFMAYVQNCKKRQSTAHIGRAFRHSSLQKTTFCPQ
jgi:hypothetical protein